MPIDASDPFISFVLVFFGSLALSVIMGTINACFSKEANATITMRIGVIVLGAFLWGRILEDSRRKMVSSVRDGTYTFWSKLYGSIGGCWIVVLVIIFLVAGIRAIVFA